MMLILLLSVASAFLDALEGDVLQTYSILAGVILASLYFITFLLLCMVLTAFFYRANMGSNEELAVLTLGKAPSTTSLVGGLEALCQAMDQAGPRCHLHSHAIFLGVTRARRISTS